jgi:FkbM family methyltransferase
MLLNFYFLHQPKGFYVDVGAYDPIQLSNTYHFYKKGWRGINIDATPGLMKRFNDIRPNDINIECAVGAAGIEVDFFVYDMPAINSVSQRGLTYAKETFGSDPRTTVKVQSKPLSVLLDENIPSDVKEIDFMTIDVEGADEEVLRSNNWDKYRPKYLCVEEHVSSKLRDSPISEFLTTMRYELVGRVGPTSFFMSVK